MIANLVQLWHASVQAVNLPYTLLLALVVLYWITVLCGVLDVDVLDLDFDMPDADASTDAAAAGGGHEGLLEYFNLSKVPLSIVVSLFALSLWLVGVLANHYLHNTTSGLLGLAVFVPNVIVSAHVAKFLTRPLVPLFKSMSADIADVRDLIGSRVTVTSTKADAAFGLAEIAGDGAPIGLTVRTEGEVLPKGTEAVVVDVESEKQVYVISKLEV